MSVLNDAMEFDHVIRITEAGNIEDATGVYCDAELEVMHDGTDNFYLPEGWELLEGFTGQHSYNGPVMHPSEFIGGGLERHILETPGYYCTLVVRTNCEHEECTAIDGCECEPAGWAIAFKDLD